MRTARLLVPVRVLSGRTYPEGTLVRIRGRGAAVDGFVGADWVPLSWWEFAEEPGDGDERAVSPPRAERPR